MANQAKAGDTVQVHYTGRLKDGTVFDSSAGREPLAFQLGSGMVIQGFDAGITGMSVGEHKSVEIPVDMAYGSSEEENKMTISRAEIPADIEYEVGMVLNMHADGTGQVAQVTVTEITPDSITLDANHPLAGKELIFDIELISIAES